MIDHEYVVITCGEPTEDACLKSLSAKHPIRIKILRNLYPISEAMNVMHRDSGDFVTCVNSDMILNEDADDVINRAIYDENRRGGKWCAIIHALYDTFEKRSIYGLVSYNNKLIKSLGVQHPNVIGSDRKFKENLEKMGYVWRIMSLACPIGNHDLRSATRGMLYSKYSDRVKKNTENYFFTNDLIRRWLIDVKNSDEKAAAALLGFLHPRPSTDERNRMIENSDPIRIWLDDPKTSDNDVIERTTFELKKRFK